MFYPTVASGVFYPTVASGDRCSWAARIFVENWTRQMKRGNQKNKIQKRRRRIG
jgi:hypothetical protein